MEEADVILAAMAQLERLPHSPEKYEAMAALTRLLRVTERAVDLDAFAEAANRG